jgi:hypothetical protein
LTGNREHDVPQWFATKRFGVGSQFVQHQGRNRRGRPVPIQVVTQCGSVFSQEQLGVPGDRQFGLVCEQILDGRADQATRIPASPTCTRDGVRKDCRSTESGIDVGIPSALTQAIAEFTVPRLIPIGTMAV